MPTYISHITWTEQGIRNVKDSPKRLDAVKKQLKTLGGELKAFYMTQGAYDALLIFEVPNDAVLAKLLLQVGSAGMSAPPRSGPIPKRSIGRLWLGSSEREHGRTQPAALGSWVCVPVRRVSTMAVRYIRLTPVQTPVAVCMRRVAV